MVFVLPRDAISRFVKGVVPLVWQHGADVVWREIVLLCCATQEVPVLHAILGQIWPAAHD